MTSTKEEIDKFILDIAKCKMKIYTTKEVCHLLNIAHKLLVRYRKEGLLPYSRVGDKYWYTQKDIYEFLRRTRN